MTEAKGKIRLSEPRATIRVTIGDQVYEGPAGAEAGDFLRATSINGYEAPLIASVVEGQLRELTYPLTRDVTVAPVLLSSSDGGRIYRRSLVMLMSVAAAELWPGVQVSVRYAVPDGGFFCTRLNGPPFSEEEIEQLETHMREIVEADDPIEKRLVPLNEAIELFQSRCEEDKVRLLEERDRDNLTLYTLRGRDDYYYGYMVPSTGVLTTFRLLPVTDGFILQYPRKTDPTSLQPIRAYDKLGAVFQQTDDWLLRMDVEDVGKLNRVIRSENHLHELVLVAEALHEQNVARIATEIARQHDEGNLRLVLIAGPSSSGKTTFAKRLAIQMLAHGIRPFTLELDNYFVDRELTPRDENGDYNFEALEAINLPLFNQHLLELTDGVQVQLPRFDFLQGKSTVGREVQLESNQIIIIEGIHGLNPNLVSSLPSEMVYRVYVSALTQLNIDAHNRVPTTDVRLIRRIVRDARTRGYTATDTIERWPSVRRGEKTNIFPYQENADVMFNSALVYELAALRPFAEPLLLQVTFGTTPHMEAKRLLSFLRWVRPLSMTQMDMIPDTSILREFIGKSTLTDYHPGVPHEDPLS
jgi:uridine kinase